MNMKNSLQISQTAYSERNAQNVGKRENDNYEIEFSAWVYRLASKKRFGESELPVLGLTHRLKFTRIIRSMSDETL
jgi:hypothetical protein